MQFPQLNLNGTDGGQLLQENMDALAAVQNAIALMGKITVHGRDYQTIANRSEAASNAYQEHRLRIQALLKIEADLTAIATEISSQLQERKRA